MRTNIGVWAERPRERRKRCAPPQFPRELLPRVLHALLEPPTAKITEIPGIPEIPKVLIRLARGPDDREEFIARRRRPARAGDSGHYGRRLGLWPHSALEGFGSGTVRGDPWQVVVPRVNTWGVPKGRVGVGRPFARTSISSFHIRITDRPTSIQSECNHEMLAKIPPELRKAAFKSTAVRLSALRGVVTQTTSGSVIDDIVAFARSSNEVRRVSFTTRHDLHRRTHALTRSFARPGTDGRRTTRKRWTSSGRG